MLRVAVIVALAVILLLPLALRRDEAGVDRAPGQRTLIIVTPHNEQIRSEFGAAFSTWHEATHGEPVHVVWSVPGGTSEIRRMLQAQVRAALRAGTPVGGNADLLFGGGSYEFGELKKPIEVEVAGPDGPERRSASVLAPIDFDDAFLHSVYGPENRIGDDQLFDPQRMWFGTALSGFGIVFNRDLLERLGVPAPTRWSDLADPRLIGAVSLVNPAQSGSISTAFEAILLRRGWDEGWRTLRRASANARTLSASSAKGPIDVAMGEAAAGVCIDFYGRYESQAILDAGGGDRVGYIDPVGETRIDADPIALLNGAPSPELARRFVEFVLSPCGQALWQLPPVHGSQATPAEESLRLGALADACAGPGRQPGPQRYELRRMPIRREMYGDPAWFGRFVDQVDPWKVATAVEKQDRNVRAFIVPLLAAMAVDEHAMLRKAWRAIIEHPAYPHAGDATTSRPLGLVAAHDVSDPTLRSMLELFDAMPTVEGPDGASFSLDAGPELSANLAVVRDGWLKEGWKDAALWPPQGAPADELRRRFRAFFAENYASILRIASADQRRAESAASSGSPFAHATSP